MALARVGVARRVLLFAFDATFALAVAVLLLIGFAEPAYAYVDPSVMTYTIQALAGVAVALSAVAGVAFRRTRRALMRVLNIDENANKEVDQKLERIAAQEANLYLDASALLDKDEIAADAKPSSGADGARQGFSWPMRFAIGLAVTIFCSLTVGVIAPLETVAGAQADLFFKVGDVAGIMLVFSAVVALVLALTLSVFRRKAFSLMTVFVFSLGLCCYIQAMFMNAGLPSADGDVVDWWGEHGFMMLVSTAVWLIVVIGFVLLCRIKERPTVALATALSLILIVVQGAGVVSLLFDGKNASADNPESVSFLTQDHLYEVSRDGNVIVFILDRYDTDILRDALAQDPQMLDGFTGFTWYPDSAQVLYPTLYAIPYLLTYQEPAQGEDVSDYLVRRYADGTFLSDLRAMDYSVCVYTDTLEEVYLSNSEAQSYIFDHVDNAHSLENQSVNVAGAVRSLMKCALYRDAPWIMKQLFRFYTDDVNQNCVNYSEGDTPDQTLWITDDPAYYRKLKANGLSFEDSDRTGAFRFIHLRGAHVPYTLNAAIEEVGEGNSSETEQARAAIGIVKAYLDELRRLGVYDDATIIITADHGYWRSTEEVLAYTSSPIMLVKESGAGDAPIRTSDARVSHKDLQASILKAVGFDGYESHGTPLDEISDPNRLRDSYFVTHDSAFAIAFYACTIDGYVHDISSWSLTGDEWDAQQ